jgi:hypothetical protein
VIAIYTLWLFLSEFFNNLIADRMILKISKRYPWSGRQIIVSVLQFFS